jgi:hypothetical protein
MRQDGFWRSCGIPVLVCLGTLAGLNALWSYPPPADYLNACPRPIAVYLLGGSGLALFLMRRALRAGWVKRTEVGIDSSGWAAPRRLAGLVLIAVFGYGMFALLRPQRAGPNGPVEASWGEYCFWYVFLLTASLAEVLVFICIAFCLIEAWLRRRGTGAVLAAAVPALSVSVAFGLYHYSHLPVFHPLVLGLMGKMFLILLFFMITRNVYLTLAFHSTFVAIDFTLLEYSGAFDPDMVKTFHQPPVFVVTFLTFLIPFLLLHWLEWQTRPAVEGKVMS